jgi:hypothetical protein
METKVEQTHRLLLQVSEKRDDGQAAEPERPAVDKIVDHFLEICSISGLIALYASSIAYSKGVPFKLDDLLSKIKYVESIYVQGFLTATTGAGLITSTMNKDIINVTFVEDKITQTVRQLLIDRADDLPNEELKTEVKEFVNIIDGYFA